MLLCVIHNEYNKIYKQKNIFKNVFENFKYKLQQLIKVNLNKSKLNLFKVQNK